jgi:GDP-mannose transporter
MPQEAKNLLPTHIESPRGSSSTNNAQSSPGDSGKPLSLSLGAVNSCLLYSLCSVSMVLTNKSLASSYRTNLSVLLVVFQAVFAVGCCEAAKYMGYITYPKFEMGLARKWLPVNVFFSLMLFTGMQALANSSVPIVTIFKNIANIFIAAGDGYFFGGQVDSLTKLAFGVMLTGAVMASGGEGVVTAVGIFWMFANCLTTAGYVLYMKHATRTVKLPRFGMVYYNNILTTVLLLPVTVVNGEFLTFLTSPNLHTVDYFLKNCWAGFVGFFLNFASLTCVAATGPTTYAIVGSVNKIPTAVLGWALFDTAIDGRTWFFIGVSMTGGFIYSAAKIKQQREREAKSTANFNS